ncbi:hypothetical protein U2I83_18350 [Bacillus amyloliquefaciens]|uniref:hypothetical protein n=1 Tax=Bacillus amyloliquefaciens TaxID=1390 RepID=UPI0032DFBBF9
MNNIKHILEIRNSILFSVIWRALFCLLYLFVVGIGFRLIGINFSPGTLSLISFIGTMIILLSIITPMRNLLSIGEFIKEYGLLERELVGKYSIDHKVLDDMIDNTMEKYNRQISFDRDYDIKDLQCIEELNKEDKNGTYLEKYISPVNDEIRMATIIKQTAEAQLYSVFNSKTLFGVSGRRYFYRWHMARLNEKFQSERNSK